MRWTVLDSAGATVSDGVPYAEAFDLLTPKRLERGWSAVCVLDKNNPPQAPAEPAAAWQPIATAPESGYVLVHEDGAIRALMRHADGTWAAPNYPALVTIVPQGLEHTEWAMVGEEAARFLAPHKLRLALRDGCCENPTHWMPLPKAPA